MQFKDHNLHLQDHNLHLHDHNQMAEDQDLKYLMVGLMLMVTLQQGQHP